MQVSVVRSAPAFGPASVEYHAGGGSATGADFSGADGVLTWDAGETGPQSFFVTIADDSLVEGTETVGLTLSNPSGGTLGSPSAATLSIGDDDNAGTIAFAASTFTGSEVDGSAPAVTITVNRTGSGDGAASVQHTATNVSASGADYQGGNGTLSWLDGETGPRTFTITITDDNVVEATERVRLTLSNVTGAAFGNREHREPRHPRRRPRGNGAVRQRRLRGRRGHGCADGHA